METGLTEIPLNEVEGARGRLMISHKTCKERVSMHRNLENKADINDRQD